MASNPVVCDSIPMALVAVMGNINCSIEKRKGSSLSSGQLYDLKRELLWVLCDEGCMSKFPFGMMELGDCEEHRGSARSEEWVTVPQVKEPILRNEKLFLDAIQVNREVYNDSQTYPYFCEKRTLSIIMNNAAALDELFCLILRSCFYNSCLFFQTQDTTTRTPATRDQSTNTVSFMQCECTPRQCVLLVSIVTKG
jgi:hypothetical protein